VIEAKLLDTMHTHTNTHRDADTHRDTDTHTDTQMQLLPSAT